MNDYVLFNQNRWNKVAEKGIRYTVPLTHEQFEAAKTQPLQVALTVGRSVPCEWFDRAVGNRLLGLACGGGQQGPTLAAKGF